MPPLPPLPFKYQTPAQTTAAVDKQALLVGALAAQQAVSRGAAPPPLPPLPGGPNGTVGPLAPGGMAPPPPGMGGGLPLPPAMPPVQGSATPPQVSAPAPAAPMPAPGQPQPGGVLPTPVTDQFFPPAQAFAAGGVIDTPVSPGQFVNENPSAAADAFAPLGGSRPKAPEPEDLLPGVIPADALVDAFLKMQRGEPVDTEAIRARALGGDTGGGAAPDAGGGAPEAFVAWLKGQAMADGGLPPDEFSQDLVDAYQQAPESVGQLWSLVVRATQNPELRDDVPPALQTLVGQEMGKEAM